MKRDAAPMHRSESTYDAIVVGSGAAGSWAVKELTEGGLSVVLLEAGRNLDVTHDFPADETPWFCRRPVLVDSDQGLVGPLCIVERGFEFGRRDVGQIAV